MQNMVGVVPNAVKKLRKKLLDLRRNGDIV